MIHKKYVVTLGLLVALLGIEIAGINLIESKFIVPEVLATNETPNKWKRLFLHTGFGKYITQTPKPTPTSIQMDTMSPTPTKTSPTSTPTTSPTPSPTSIMTNNGSEIRGKVTSDVLGTCTASIHDRYVTRGDDGKIYRTWHPIVVPVDPNNPNGEKCTMAHDHGDDPSSSNIFDGKQIAFGYIGYQMEMPMDEPHPGFKCAVTNAGTTNDEGTQALHDAYYCFHMGTGGVGRYTERFHSLIYNLKTKGGYHMRIQGMADVGNVGTICDNPRNARTVMGLGCKLDSAYEIWENTLRITNNGNSIATAVLSTAVFDPITVMDPNDKTRLIYSWSAEASQNIFKFPGDRSNYRSCNRETYSGPVLWNNRGGELVYMTDAYGRVNANGTLRQEISNINTNSNEGYIDNYGALIMGYSGGNGGVPQSQFKYPKSYCVGGLGLKN